MFEAACSDRIQQFDDEDESEDEEDEYDSGTWSNKDANLASPMEHRRWVWLYMPSGTVVLELYVCGCVSDSWVFCPLSQCKETQSVTFPLRPDSIAF